MLVLAIGDLHIPDRAIDIPAKFKKLLQPTGKIQQVLCLGNSTTSQTTLDFLKSLSLDFQIVKGEFDQDMSIPLSLVFNYDKLKVGLINGFQIIPKADPLSLLTQARMMDVDVLIYGSTHKVEAYTLDGKFFVNPGSATGAFSSGKMDAEDMEIIERVLAEKKGNDQEQEQELGQEQEQEQEQEQGQVEEKEKEKEEEKDKQDELSASADKIGDEETGESPSSQHESESQVGTTVTDTTEEKDGAIIPEAAAAAAVGPPKSNIHPEDVEQDNEEDLNVEDIEDYMDPIPSFCLLDIQGTVCTLYLYTLIDGEVKVDKLTYRKEQK